MMATGSLLPQGQLRNKRVLTLLVPGDPIATQVVSFLTVTLSFTICLRTGFNCAELCLINWVLSYLSNGAPLKQICLFLRIGFSQPLFHVFGSLYLLESCFHFDYFKRINLIFWNWLLDPFLWHAFLLSRWPHKNDHSATRGLGSRADAQIQPFLHLSRPHLLQCFQVTNNASIGNVTLDNNSFVLQTLDWSHFISFGVIFVPCGLTFNKLLCATQPDSNFKSILLSSIGSLYIIIYESIASPTLSLYCHAPCPFHVMLFETFYWGAPCPKYIKQKKANCI